MTDATRSSPRTMNNALAKTVLYVRHTFPKKMCIDKDMPKVSPLRSCLCVCSSVGRTLALSHGPNEPERLWCACLLSCAWGV